MRTLFLVEKEYNMLMSGTNTEFIGIFSTYEMAESAFTKQHNIENFTRLGKNHNIWKHVFDGELIEYYTIKEVGLDVTREEYNELKSREVPDRKGIKTNRIFTDD
jgi:hypothetical protein